MPGSCWSGIPPGPAASSLSSCNPHKETRRQRFLFNESLSGILKKTVFSSAMSSDYAGIDFKSPLYTKPAWRRRRCSGLGTFNVSSRQFISCLTLLRVTLHKNVHVWIYTYISKKAKMRFPLTLIWMAIKKWVYDSQTTNRKKGRLSVRGQRPSHPPPHSYWLPGIHI
jgi:hypothetical protein